MEITVTCSVYRVEDKMIGRLEEFHDLGGSKGGMKVGGVKEVSPSIVESTIGIL